MTKYNFRWSLGKDGFQGLRECWQELADRLTEAQYFQRPQWFEAFLGLCDRPQDLIWFSAWQDSTLVAVLPLLRTRRRLGPLPIVELQAINHEHMTIADVCAAADQAQLWPAWWRWLHGPEAPKWHRLSVARTLEHGVFAGWLRQTLPKHALQSVVSGSAYLDCRRTYDELIAACGSKHRSNLSRGSRKAAAIGVLSWERAETVEDIQCLFPRLLDIEASGWKGKQGSAIACSPAVQRFYEDLIKDLAPRKQCGVDLLKFEDRDVAGIFWFRTARTMHLQKIGFREEYSDFSPGQLMTKEMVERTCADSVLDTYCFVTNPDWALPWRPTVEPVIEIAVYCDKPYGALLYGLNGLRRRLQPPKSVEAAENKPEDVPVPGKTSDKGKSGSRSGEQQVDAEARQKP